MSKRVLNNSASGTVTWKDAKAAIRHYHDMKDYISLYHKAIRKTLGVKHVYSFGSGRGALYAILKAKGIGKGDEVVIQGYTCVAVPKGVIYTGATPVYADINKNDYNMTYESVVKVVNDSTKAVIVQHTYGIPCHDIYKIRALCKKQNILMIEDCAHTFGVRFGKDMMGAIGDAAFFSTDHGKYISTSTGGFAVTNDDVLGENLKNEYLAADELTQREIRFQILEMVADLVLREKRVQYVIRNNLFLSYAEAALDAVQWKKIGRGYLVDYNNMEFPSYTFPGKLSNIQAYMGLRQIRKLREIIGHRSLLTNIYKKRLSVKFDIPDDICAVMIFPVCVENPMEWYDRFGNILQLGRTFSNEILCIDRAEYSKVSFDPSKCLTAESVSRHIITLPTCNKVSVEDAEEICRILLRY